MPDEEATDWRKALELSKHEIERVRLEIDRANIDKQRAETDRQRTFLERWNADMSPQHSYIVEHDRSSMALALNAIKSMYILNGGALIALPAFYGFLERVLPTTREAISESAVAFTTGLVLAALTSLLAYIAQTQYGKAASEGLNWRAIKLNAPLGTTDQQLMANPNYTASLGAQRHARDHAEVYRWAALAVGILSLLAFIVGAVAVLRPWA